MILAAVYVLFLALEGGWAAQAIAVASTALMMRTKLNPLVLVLGGGAALVAFQLAGGGA